MISRNRLSWFGHVCRMNDDRLPKRIFLSRISLSLEQKVVLGLEKSYARCLIDDFETFNLVCRMPREHIKDWVPRRWDNLRAMAADRVGWRKLVKRDGVYCAMTKWFHGECEARNKRHRNEDGYIEMTPYEFKSTCSIHKQTIHSVPAVDDIIMEVDGVEIQANQDIPAVVEEVGIFPDELLRLKFIEAVRIGAVTTGRGRREKHSIF